eukprot:scaffold2478_cov220-Alexandrium_tamarense.AAC.9
MAARSMVEIMRCRRQEEALLDVMCGALIYSHRIACAIVTLNAQNSMHVGHSSVWSANKREAQPLILCEFGCLGGDFMLSIL